MNVSFTKQQTLFEFFCDSSAESEDSDKNIDLQSESPQMTQKFAKKPTLAELEQNLGSEFQLEKSETSVSQAKAKFLHAKTTLRINKIRSRIEQHEILRDPISSPSEGVSKSLMSGEKAEPKERNVKDFWLSFKKSFVHNEEIKRFQKKVLIN